MDECIFCMIGQGKIPAKVIWEDERVVAFDDVSPQAPVHALVIPRKHYADLGDDLDPEDLRAIFAAVPRVAEIKGVDGSGYRVIINSGPDANQTVKHLHVHVMGGREMSHGMVRFSDE